MLQNGSLHADPGGMELDLNLASGFHCTFSLLRQPICLFSPVLPALLRGLSSLGPTFAVTSLRLEGCLGMMLCCWAPVNLTVGGGGLDLFDSKLGLWPSHTNRLLVLAGAEICNSGKSQNHFVIL